MARCQNCESHVTEQYVAVFAPNDADHPRCCPNCEDKIREGADVRDARAHRGGNGEDPISYDPEMFAGGGSA
ncbi:hypothetical protein [Haloarcula sp. Atlit-120R]|uniref:DUF7563 family protein n=1 Tax=Haloarcula sp. Atlit-120R TaxID=2282135 RepID=UPI000EF277E5|nr:hypothetical protein [Haloarcula sp. Atlit-120R]RLM32670.1 hypothetical protein DVK01_20580 [Haloarcula sp. Atlit-120R]